MHPELRLAIEPIKGKSSMQPVNRPLKISIIIPCYKQEKYLYESILSAKQSTTRLVEIIVINDGGDSKGFFKRAEELKVQFSDPRCNIILHSQQNKGLPATRNTGIELATGDYIQFLDADDMLVATKIDQQLDHFALVSGIDVSISDSLFANDRLDEFQYSSHMINNYWFSITDFALSWERGFSIPVHCALFKRSVFDKAKFSETIRAKEDWVFWVDLVNNGFILSPMGFPGAIYRVHPSSMCRDLDKMGRAWIKAALHIDEKVSTACPIFFEKALEWYNESYSRKVTTNVGSGAPIYKLDFQSSVNDIEKSFSLSDVHVAEVSAESQQKSTVALTVIVPVYNHADYLESCIDSILRGADQSVEVIIVDDASPDRNVRRILEDRYKDLNNVELIFNEDNQGIAHSQNQAIWQARGTYIAFVDCDDMITGNALSEVFGVVSQDDSYDYIFSDRFDIDEKNNYLRLARYGGYRESRFNGNVYEDLLFGMVASHLKVIKTDTLRALGGFRDEYSGVQDWDLALRVREIHGKFKYVSKPLYYHRIHSNSVTSSDQCRQYRLTNMLREEALMRDPAALSGARDRLKQICSLITGSDIEAQIPEDALFQYDARGPLSRKTLWFLREFNSFFDRVLVDSVEGYIALIGYMGSPHKLIFDKQ